MTFPIMLIQRSELTQEYANRKEFGKKCLINIANAGKFSSDRTIQEYVDDIWHLDKIR